MRDHQSTRSGDVAGRVRKPAPPQGAFAAGNRAMAEVLSPRPVQRWPDLDDLGGLLGGGPAMGNPTPDLGGLMPSMPSLPDLPSMPDLGGLLGGGPTMGNPTPDLGGLLPSMPSLPDMPSLSDLPSLPSMPSMNIPGINLNVDTDAGTASGGIDFHDGTSGRASYGPKGLDLSGQSGSTKGSGHVGGARSWDFSGSTTTRGGTALSGSLGRDRDNFSGQFSGVGPGGERGSLTGHGNMGGQFGGAGSYAGQYGNLDIPF